MTHEELVEMVARALITNQPLQKFDFDKARMTYDYTAPATAAIATIREALSEPDNAQVIAFQDEYNTIARESGWVNRGTVPDDVSVKRLLVATLADSPLVAREEK